MFVPCYVVFFCSEFVLCMGFVVLDLLEALRCVGLFCACFVFCCVAPVCVY